METNEKAIDLMEDPEFLAKLDKAQGVDEYKAIFAAEGIDVDEEAPEGGEGDMELSAEALDDVAGGASYSDAVRYVQTVSRIYGDLKNGVKNPGGILKFGAAGGIMLRAITDYKLYGNPTRSYSAQQIQWAASYFGCK